MSTFVEEVEATGAGGKPGPAPKRTSEEEEQHSPKSLAIVQDHVFVKEFVPKAAILTLNKECITVVIMRTAYARVQLRVLYSEEYPSDLPIVELSSPSLPMPLLRNKEQQCLTAANAAIGMAQFQAIYEVIYEFTMGNIFIPCWKEMKQVKALCHERDAQIGADDKEGIVQIRMQTGSYKQAVKIRVPYSYPEEGVEFEFQASNFPADVQFMFRSQAEEIVRRCVAGFSLEQALQVSNPIQFTDTVANNSAVVAAAAAANGSCKGGRRGGPQVTTRITAEGLKGLKHDVDVLKQISDLRSATVADKSSSTYVTQANAERRVARKDLRRLARAESAADEAEQQALREQEEREMQQLMRAKMSDVAQPSLYALVRFLVEDYGTRLPNEMCQACKKPILPADPAAKSSDTQKRSSKGSSGGGSMRPMRTFCGHWLHHRCLNEWLTTPPFVRQCPVCTRRIWHPDWPEDAKQLEKAWQHKEARKREVNDVSDFMGMGDEFVTEAAKKGDLGL